MDKITNEELFKRICDINTKYESLRNELDKIQSHLARQFNLSPDAHKNISPARTAIKVICDLSEVSEEQVYSRKKRPKIAAVRFICYKILHELLGIARDDIGPIMMRKERWITYYGIREVDNRCSVDANFRAHYDLCVQRVKETLGINA